VNITSSSGTVTSVAAERADGQVLTFTPNGTGGYTSDTDVDVTLSKSGSVWTLKDHDDTVETYNDLGTGQALLATITARNGYAQTLSYNGSNQLSTVTDSYSRTLTLTYSGGLLNTVTTPGGLVLTYGYTAVTGGSVLTSVGYNTSPATSQTYKYENTTFPFALTGVVDELGHRVNTWGYDALGRGILSERFSDNASPTPTAIEKTMLVYNSNGTVTVTNPLGLQETYTFTTLQNVAKVTEIDRAANGTTVAAASRTFAYDTTYGYQNCSTRWTATPQNCLTTTTGDATQVTNNAHGQPTSITEAYGSAVARTTGITYDTTFVHLPSVITEPTRSTAITYDGNGNVATSTVTDEIVTSNPVRTWTYTWNSTGEPLTAKGPRTDVNQTTTMTYTSGNLATITDALGHETQFTSYDADGRLKGMTDPNGLPTAFTYDMRGSLLTTAVGTTATSGGSQVTTLTRDATETVTSKTNPDGSSLTFGRDYAHRLTSVTNSLVSAGNGDYINYTLDAAGNRTEVDVYASGGTLNRKHTYTFDALSRMATDVDYYSNTTTYGYDSNSNLLTVSDPLAEVTTYAYDPLNRVNSIKNPLNNTTTITYTTDTRNLPYQVTSPRGVGTVYGYDGFGEQTSAYIPDSGLTSHTFDLAGNVATSEDANGNTTTYTYDALNRRKTATYADSTVSNYYYDSQTNAVGRLKQIADPTVGGANNQTYFGYDIYGNISWKQNSYTGQQYTSVTDPNTGHLTSETYPSGMVISYQYDSAGQQKEIDVNAATSPSTASYITHITHQPFGPAASWYWVANYTQYVRTFDMDGRLSTYPLGTGDTRTLTYDAASRVTGIADSATPTNSQTIGYDAASQITSYTGPFGNGTQTETYDADGNRTQIAAGGVTENYAIDNATPSNRILSRTIVGGATTNYVYDAGTGGNGDVTTEGVNTFSYDDRQRMSGWANNISQTEAYVYNGLDERMKKSGNGGSARYFFGAAGNALTGRMLGEYASPSNAVAQETVVVDGYLPVGTTPTGTTSAQRTNVLRTYAGHLDQRLLATDHYNSPFWSWDPDAFGAGLTNDNPGGHGNYYIDTRFPGQIFDDESNTYANVTRSYDPNRGRYLQSDKIGLGGGMNTYNYVANDPANMVDPDGRNPLLVIVGIGAAVGGVSGAITTGNTVGWSWNNAGTIAFGAAIGAGAGAAGAVSVGAGAVGLASTILAGGAGGAAGDFAGQLFTKGSFSCVDPKEVALQGVLGAGAGAFGALPVIALGDDAYLIGATYSSAFTIGLQSEIPADRGGFGWAQWSPARPEREPLRITVHPRPQ
jgi:RHS repeat-associated protein